MAIRIEQPTIRGLMTAMIKAAHIVGDYDLRIVGGHLSDDSAPIRLTILTADSTDWEYQQPDEETGEIMPAIGLFIE